SCRLMRRPAAEPVPSVEKHIRARHPWTAGAYALEYSQFFGTMIFSETRISPRIVHDDNAAFVDSGLRQLKTSRPDIGPFLAAIDHNDIEEFVGHGSQI